MLKCIILKTEPTIGLTLVSREFTYTIIFYQKVEFIFVNTHNKYKIKNTLTIPQYNFTMNNKQKQIINMFTSMDFKQQHDTFLELKNIHDVANEKYILEATTKDFRDIAIELGDEVKSQLLSDMAKNVKVVAYDHEKMDYMCKTFVSIDMSHDIRLEYSYDESGIWNHTICYTGEDKKYIDNYDEYEIYVSDNEGFVADYDKYKDLKKFYKKVADRFPGVTYKQFSTFFGGILKNFHYAEVKIV